MPNIPDPAKQKAAMKILRFLFKTRPGTFTLGAATGMAAGYPIIHGIRPKLATMALPEGYYAEPRYRIYRRKDFVPHA